MRKLLALLALIPGVSFGSGIYNPGSGTGGGGGGASSLEVFVGATRSSPTASISANPNQFTGTVSGSTFTFNLNSSSVTLQGNSILMSTLQSSINTINGQFPVSLSTGVVNILPVLNGGSGTSTPGLVAGTNITSITGSWPNQTINAATQGGGSGASTLEVFAGATRSSPTATISMNPNDFSAQIQGGSTFYFALNAATTDFIHNQTTSQSATLNVTSGTINNFIATDSTATNFTSSVYTFPNQGNTRVLFMNGGNMGTSSTFVWNGTTMTATKVSASTITVTTRLDDIGADGANVKYGLSVGSMTGAGLSACGDATHALSYASTGLFGCQAITATGGGGGASTLAVTTGTTAGWVGVEATSPTIAINLDQSQFSATLQGGATSFVTLRSAISSVSGNFTLASTSTVVLADATGGSLTVTLPTAVGIAGKIYTVKRISSGENTVTVGTTSAQTIDGATTQVLTSQYTSIDVISDGASWSIL